jgi:TATA-box binding protein (TBP) (component of TFIID and TFIIIB)
VTGTLASRNRGDSCRCTCLGTAAHLLDSRSPDDRRDEAVQALSFLPSWPSRGFRPPPPQRGPAYRQFLWYVPRLVNVVSLAEAVPAEGSGVTLPLDLRKIASRCRGAFYAPARFAAVQLAFSQPRSRILIFHTGRLVGTGTTGSIAARVAITRAQRQLAVEAGIYLNIQSFQVINTVGAVSLRASLNCDAFATAHSSDAHYDRASFVGLAWRPPRESLCCGARLLPLPLPRVRVPLSARIACVQKYTALGEGRSQKTCSGLIAPTQTQPRKRRVWWSTRQRVAPLRVPTNRSKWSWIKSQKTCGPVGVEA